MKKILTISLLLATIGQSHAQWSSNPFEPQELLPAQTSTYASEVKAADDGSLWHVIYHPQGADEYDIPNVTYQYIIQRFDPEGNKQFDDLGLLISQYRNKSYTVVNDYLMVDRDGNAIVSVLDWRNSPSDDRSESYTVYKISPTGEMLWDEEGVLISGTDPIGTLAKMTMTQLDDGSYVFAWMYYTDSSSVPSIGMQRVSADGKLLWNPEEVNLTDKTVAYSTPWLVNAGDNQVIMVYLMGSNQDIYARKIDFDGTNAWAKDTRIYRGGFGQIPVWTIADVQPSGDGGVIVGWNDDRGYTNIESAYISYVTSDGKLGFANASDEGDVKVGYSGFRCFNCKVTADPDGDGFLALWRETDSGQNWQNARIQRISKSGELLWNEEGIELFEIDQLSTGYFSIQSGADGQVAAFYMINRNSSVDAYVHLFDSKTGEPINDSQPYRFTTGSHERTSLNSVNIPEQNCWILTWNDDGDLSTGNGRTGEKFITRMNYDLTFGMPGAGIDSASTDAAHFSASYDNGVFNICSSTTGRADITIYDLNGKLVDVAYSGTLAAGSHSIKWNNATPGIKIARVSCAGGETTLKAITK